MLRIGNKNCDRWMIDLVVASDFVGNQAHFYQFTSWRNRLSKRKFAVFQALAKGHRRARAALDIRSTAQASADSN